MTQEIDHDAQRKIVNRLKRASGQLNAVIKLMETEASCRDVITQLSAVSSAIDRAGFAIIATAMKTCVDEPSADGSKNEITTAELEKLFLQLA